MTVPGSEVGIQSAGDVSLRGQYVAGRDLHVYEGPDASRPDYRFDIRALLDFYTEVFVGRDEEIALCGEFAASERPGYLLVEAPPAHGKSALVAQLVDRAERGAWPSDRVADIVVFFVREEGRRDTPDAFLTAVNAQLLDLLELRGGVPSTVDAAARQFSSLWSRAARSRSGQRPLLLLVDGLDEMADTRPSIAELLPSGLAPYVHVIVSSRPNPEPLKLVSPEHPMRRSVVRRLETFGLEDIEALLASRGESAGNGTLARRILDKTRGEPLLAGFVCEDVAASGESALAVLPTSVPGVREYFEWQLERLRERAADDELARNTLAVLLLTRGPVSIAELSEILRRSPDEVERAMEPILRFLVGRERIELMHLELRAALENKLSAAQRTASLRSIIDWCAAYRAAGFPVETPAYVLEHYAAHLHSARDVGALDELLDRKWMKVKLRRLGSHASMAHDVQQAIDLHERSERRLSKAELRLRFLLASLTSEATSAPPQLIGALVELDQADRAEGYARLGVGSARVASFAEIAAASMRLGQVEQGERFLVEVENLLADESDDATKMEARFYAVVALIGAGFVEPMLALLPSERDIARFPEVGELFAMVLAGQAPPDEVRRFLAITDRYARDSSEYDSGEFSNLSVQVEVQTGDLERAIARAVGIDDLAVRVEALAICLSGDGSSDAWHSSGALFEDAVAALPATARTDGAIAGYVLLGKLDHARELSRRAGHDRLPHPGTIALTKLAFWGRSAEASVFAKFADLAPVSCAEALFSAASELGKVGHVDRAVDCTRAGYRFNEAGPQDAGGVERLAVITLALARSGETERALHLMERTLAAAGLLSDNELNGLLEQVLVAQFAAGASETTWRLLALENEYTSARPIAGVVAALSSDGRTAEAVAVAEAARAHGAGIDRSTVTTLAEIGEFDRAAALIPAVEEEGGWRRTGLVSALVAAGLRSRSATSRTKMRELALTEAKARPDERWQALEAFVMAVCGDREQAAAAVQAASAEIPEEAYLLGEYLQWLVPAATALGDIEQARRWLAQLSAWYEVRTDALRSHVAILLEQKRRAEAVATIRDVSAGWARMNTLKPIIVDAVRAGYHDQAAELVQDATDGDMEVAGLAFIAETLAAAGQHDAAIGMLNAHGVEWRKAPRLDLTIRCLAERGQSERAQTPRAPHCWVRTSDSESTTKPLTGERLLTIVETAEKLGCSERTIRRRIGDGVLPAFRDRGLVRVREGDLERYVAANVTRAVLAK